MGVENFSAARALVAARLSGGAVTAESGWQDANAFRVAVLHPPFGEPSPDGVTFLVDKHTGEISAVGYLPNRARLDAMKPTT